MATTLEPPLSTTFDGGESLPAWLNPDFGPLIDTLTGEIGRVVSSEQEPAGAHQFHFWAADSALTLDVGHIVVAFSEEAAVIGVVDEPRRYSDLRSFMDDYFDRHMEQALAEEAPTRRPEILVYTVTVLATKHPRPDVISHRPVIHGPVYFATRDAIEQALDTENFSGMPIPALMHTNGNYERDLDTGQVLYDGETGLPRFQRTPIFLDEEYLLGPEAGHANWTGQSGLATKTSHALFLISSIFQKMGEQGKSVAALMFNVKGPDLLWLDKPADPAPGHEPAYEVTKWRGLGEADHLAYRALDLVPEPFDQLRIYAPFRPGTTPSAVGTGGDVIHLAAFGKTPEEYARLNTARQQPGETENVYPILWSLQTALWYPHKVFDFNDLDDKMMGFIFELREAKINSINQLNAKFDEIQAHFDNQDEKSDYWNGHHKATINKAKNRFKGLQDKLGGLLADGQVDYGGSTRQVDAPFAAQEMRVVDISACNTVVQDLIVTSTINKIWNMAEKSELGVDKLIIFVDELNKYAAAGSQSSLRDTLVDIAARGRHLNVVLFGAEQFRSKVDDEILGNCGTALYGRVGDEEIINAAYRSLSETAKAELLGLPKGRLLIRHAHFRAPLFGTFPHPPTLPGIYGQRIFGAQRLSDPCDGLIATLRRLMGDRAPSNADVRNAAMDLAEEQIDQVRRDLDMMYAKGANTMQNPWKAAQRKLLTLRSMSNRS